MITTKRMMMTAATAIQTQLILRFLVAATMPPLCLFRQDYRDSGDSTKTDGGSLGEPPPLRLGFVGEFLVGCDLGAGGDDPHVEVLVYAAIGGEVREGERSTDVLLQHVECPHVHARRAGRARTPE